MYSQDSFFDLSPWGQAGLICISTVLFLVTLLSVRRALFGRPIWLAIPGALVVFWVFVWVSPQIYYTYYRTIIPDLPLQWVIWPPPWPVEAVWLLIFQGPQNLSAHSQGLLGWSLVVAPFIGKATRRA